MPSTAPAPPSDSLAADTDAALVAEYAAHIAALRYEPSGWLECLVLSPATDEHRRVRHMELVPGAGPTGQYPGKQWWQGARVPGRQISAVSADVLDVLEIDHDVPGDNLIIRGLDLTLFQPGDTLRIGDALLFVTQTPHRPCAKLAARTTPAKKAALSIGRLRGLLLDTLHPATVHVGDAAERIVLGDTAQYGPARAASAPSP